MISLSRFRRFLCGVFALAVAGVAATWGATSATATAGTTLIVGSGSSWAYNAINQWIADVHSSGLQISFTSSGSAQGRIDYANYTTDFAVSDIGYQGVDPVTGAQDTSQGRSYAYLPIVAGGTAIPYNLSINGQRVTNLRLSGDVIAKIFTRQITNWNDQSIQKENPGLKMPDEPITPVVHSEGSGSTYQLTRYFGTEYSSIWKPFSGISGSGATEYFPNVQSPEVAENGSDSVINFITGAAGAGSIGYDEYSYALGAGFPVVQIENRAGYYVLPNQYNVAVALTQAEINMHKSSSDYLLQNLDKVYVYGDSRTYPISSYSYSLIPTASNDQRMTSAKRQTIADYLDFSVCQGQQQMGPIGYSPLPINLVKASFAQVGKLHTADPSIDVSSADVSKCNNPTFDPKNPGTNYLAEVAPYPPACDKAGPKQCAPGVDTSTNNNPTGPKTDPHPGKGVTTTPAPGGGGQPSTSPDGGNGGGGPGAGTRHSTGPAGATQPAAGQTSGAPTGGSTTSAANGIVPIGSGGSPPASTSVDPVTGQTYTALAAGGVVGGAANLAEPAAFTQPAANSSQTNLVLAIIAGILVVLLLVVPPVVAGVLRKRGGHS